MTRETPESADPRLMDVALRLTDGEAVDWEQARESGQDLGSTLERLRVLELLAREHRGTPAEGAEAAASEPVRFAWGPLRVLAPLGEGGSGEVWRAWDPALQREVALKLRRQGDRASRRWLDEARRLARVRHPHVLSVHGADVHDSRAGLWTDLVRGATLEERLASDGPLGPREAALVGMVLCEALSAVHAAGLVHGDVKAKNVMRAAGTSARAESAGRIVLMDFGSAHETRSPDAETGGTPLYAAPELLEGGSPTVQSDLYAVGVLLHRLVTGAFPAEAASLEELRARLREGRLTPLRTARPDAPIAFAQVVERAMAHDPAARFADAASMERALAAAVGAEAGAAAVGARSRGRTLTPMALGGLAVGLACAAIAWLPGLIAPRFELSSDLDASPYAVHQMLTGSTIGGAFGMAAAVCDLDADGRPELFVTAPGESAYFGTLQEFALGSEGRFEPHRVRIGEHAADAYGYSVAAVGDVTGDGLVDLAVSAVNHDGAKGDEGRVHILHGGPGLDDAAPIVLDGVTPSAAFGFRVAGAGDLNGDGIGDLIVGAPGDRGPSAGSGRAFIWFGGAGLGGAADLEFTLGLSEAQVGMDVCGVGDVNGDGFDDVAIGTNWARDGSRRRGRVDVLYGGPGFDARPDLTLVGPDPEGWFGSLCALGDIDGDGYDDFAVGAQRADGYQEGSGAAYLYRGGSPPSTKPWRTLRGEESGSQFGNRIADAGDLNGDGVRDLAVGALYSSAAGSSSGATYLYLCGPRMDETADARIAGLAPHDWAGHTLASLGDAWGTGFSGLAIGAPSAIGVGHMMGRLTLLRFGRYQLQQPRDGEVVRAGSSVEVRWQGSLRAVIEVASGGGEWIELARAAGGARQNLRRVTLPSLPPGSATLRLRPVDPAVRGEARVSLRLE